MSLVWNASDTRRFDTFPCNKLGVKVAERNQHSKACSQNSNFVTVTCFLMMVMLLPLLLRMSMKFVTHKRHLCAHNIINDTFMVCFPLLHSLSRSVHSFGHLSTVCEMGSALVDAHIGQMKWKIEKSIEHLVILVFAHAKGVPNKYYVHAHTLTPTSPSRYNRLLITLRTHPNKLWMKTIH